MLSEIPKAYLEPCQTSAMKFFVKVMAFLQKYPLQLFDSALNMPLNTFSITQRKTLKQ